MSILLFAQILWFASAQGNTIMLVSNADSVFEGDEIRICVDLSDALKNVASLDLRLTFNEDVLEYRQMQSDKSVVASKVLRDADGAFFRLTIVDRTSEGVQITAGTLATVIFTAKSVSKDSQTSVLLSNEGVYDNAFREITVSADEAASIIIQKIQPEKLTVQTMPQKITYAYKEAFDPKGLVLSLEYNNGKTERIEKGYTVSPTVFKNQNGLPLFGIRGETPVTVRYDGTETTFFVQVHLTPVQWVIKILLFGWLWY